MPNGPDGWARPIAEIRIDSRSPDDALTDLYRWLVQEPDLGAAGVRVKRGAGHTSGMGLPEWLQVSADSLAVGSLLVRSLTACGAADGRSSRHRRSCCSAGTAGSTSSATTRPPSSAPWTSWSRPATPTRRTDDDRRHPAGPRRVPGG